MPETKPENKIVFIEKSNYANKCVKCGKWIPANSPCYWEKGTKQNWHKQCHEEDVIEAMPKHITLTSSQTKKADEVIDKVLHPHIEQQADAYLTENIKACKNAYDAEFGELPLMYGAVIMSQLIQVRHAFMTSMKIAKQEREKMDAYGKKG